MDRASRLLAAGAALAAGRDRGDPDRGPGQAAAVRSGPDAVEAERLGLATMAMEGVSPAPFVPCGLPLALGCRRLWRPVYRRGAWTAGVAPGAVAVTLPAGLLGPFAIAVCAVAVGVPVRIAWRWLAWRA